MNKNISKFFFQLQNIKGCLPFTKVFEVIFNLQKYLRSSSIYKNILDRFPFTKYLRSSSIYKIFEVVFH
jgi:hypothetical protein